MRLQFLHIKLHGLKGSGALVMRKGLAPEAINFGGGQESGLRSGTVSVADAVALAKAMRLSAVDTEQKEFRAVAKSVDSCSKTI